MLGRQNESNETICQEGRMNEMRMYIRGGKMNQMRMYVGEAE